MLTVFILCMATFLLVKSWNITLSTCDKTFVSLFDPSSYGRLNVATGR